MLGGENNKVPKKVMFMNEVINIVDSMKNTTIKYDDKITRKLIDCIKVMSKNELLIIFKGGIQKTVMIGE